MAVIQKFKSNTSFTKGVGREQTFADKTGVNQAKALSGLVNSLQPVAQKVVDDYEFSRATELNNGLTKKSTALKEQFNKANLNNSKISDLGLKGEDYGLSDDARMSDLDSDTYAQIYTDRRSQISDEVDTGIYTSKYDRKILAGFGQQTAAQGEQAKIASLDLKNRVVDENLLVENKSIGQAYVQDTKQIASQNGRKMSVDYLNKHAMVTNKPFGVKFKAMEKGYSKNLLNSFKTDDGQTAGMFLKALKSGKYNHADQAITMNGQTKHLKDFINKETIAYAKNKWKNYLKRVGKEKSANNKIKLSSINKLLTDGRDFTNEYADDFKDIANDKDFAHMIPAIKQISEINQKRDTLSYNQEVDLVDAMVAENRTDDHIKDAQILETANKFKDSIAARKKKVDANPNKLTKEEGFKTVTAQKNFLEDNGNKHKFLDNEVVSGFRSQTKEEILETLTNIRDEKEITPSQLRDFYKESNIKVGEGQRLAVISMEFKPTDAPEDEFTLLESLAVDDYTDKQLSDKKQILKDTGKTKYADHLAAVNEELKEFHTDHRFSPIVGALLNRALMDNKMQKDPDDVVTDIKRVVTELYKKETTAYENPDGTIEYVANNTIVGSGISKQYVKEIGPMVNVIADSLAKSPKRQDNTMAHMITEGRVRIKIDEDEVRFYDKEDGEELDKYRVNLDEGNLAYRIEKVKRAQFLKKFNVSEDVQQTKETVKGVFREKQKEISKFVKENQVRSLGGR